VRVLLVGGDGSDELVRLVQGAVASVRGSVMAARAREALRVDVTAELLSCPVPVLFLGGKRDRLLRSGLPIEVRALRADVEIRMLDAPHLALQTHPDEAMRLLEGFALRCAQGGRRGAADGILRERGGAPGVEARPEAEAAEAEAAEAG
jgi:pimeloyl-ACP methyl ester carboxylesterase